MTSQTSPFKKPYVIVVGNEKGGTGKSTITMHVIVALLRNNLKVGSIDVDARQGTLSRYLENRRAYREQTEKNLPLPDHHQVFKSQFDTQKIAEQDEQARFQDCLEKMQQHDVVLIDTPGTDNFLSRLAHSYADTLLTPLNDSFIDLDMLARVSLNNRSIEKPSAYSEMVWDQRKHRILRDKAEGLVRKSMDWIVLRNRLTNLLSRNKEDMQEVLEKLSERIGFRLVAGFSERVIFRELFLSGLTLLDFSDLGLPLSLSHVAARQELRDLLNALNLPSFSSAEKFDGTGKNSGDAPELIASGGSARVA